MNKLIALVITGLVLLSTVAFAFADVPNVTTGDAATVVSIKVNGDDYSSGDTLQEDLGTTLNIRLKVQANQNIDNLEASARLVGYEYNDADKVSDTSGLFSMKSGDTRYVDLSVKIPTRADKDVYELRVNLDGRTQSFSADAFTIRVSGPRKAILIRDVILTPSGSIESGRSVLGSARLENIGERDETDVKVTMSIPELNVEGSVYMNSLNGETTLGRGETKSSEEIYLRIPPCAKAGTYTLVTDVSFDETQNTSTTKPITIVDGGVCTQMQSGNANAKPVVTAPGPQTVQIGVGGASFPITIQNPSSVSKTFVVGVSGLSDWGMYQISDPTPVVGPGETKIVYIYVTALDGITPGVRTFGIDVTVDGQKSSTTAQAVLTQGTTSSSWKSVLITLAIILGVIVVILAIVLAVRKMGGKGDEPEDDLDSKGQAYY